MEPTNDSSRRIDGWRVFGLAWFIWIPAIAAVGLFVAGLVLDWTYLLIAPLVAAVAFLMWHFVEAADE